MIEAKDLRIDNFIRLKENGNIFDVQVVGTRCESIDVYNNGIYTSYLKNIDYYLEPIPLTEEWLVKFGFELVTKSTKKYMIKNTYNEPCFFKYKAQGVFAFRYQNTTVYNVHQLQNLYFALTGEELTIKK